MRKNKAIAIIAAICAVSIAGGVVGYTVGQRSEYMTIGAPHATPSEMPEGITVGAVGAITVPGYERMSFKAGQKEQPVILYNPAGNDCAFIVSIVLPSGKEIYRSNELLPGESIDAIEISDPLDPAIYEKAVLRYSCYCSALVGSGSIRAMGSVFLFAGRGLCLLPSSRSPAGLYVWPFQA